MKKGFTLVELIAVLVVLSVIALIVTPNIMVSVKQYQEQAYETEMKAIESAAKNWVADNIDSVPTDENTTLVLKFEELDGYYDQDAKNPKGGTFEDVFVLIKCKVIKDELDEFDEKEVNYKYTYEAYSSIDEFITAKALKYAKTKKLTEDSLISIDDNLISDGYIDEHMIYTNDKGEFVLEDKDIEIKVTEKGKTEKTYEYEITIN